MRAGATRASGGLNAGLSVGVRQRFGADSLPELGAGALGGFGAEPRQVGAEPLVDISAKARVGVGISAERLVGISADSRVGVGVGAERLVGIGTAVPRQIGAEVLHRFSGAGGGVITAVRMTDPTPLFRRIGGEVA